MHQFYLAGTNDAWYFSTLFLLVTFTVTRRFRVGVLMCYCCFDKLCDLSFHRKPKYNGMHWKVHKPNSRITNFRCNELCKYISIFQFMNIIFGTTKKQPLSDGRMSVSWVTNSSQHHLHFLKIESLILTLIIEENWITFLSLFFVIIVVHWLRFAFDKGICLFFVDTSTDVHIDLQHYWSVKCKFYIVHRSLQECFTGLNR